MGVWRHLGVLSLAAVAAFGQGMVEYGAAVGRAGAAGVGIGATGKSTADLLNRSVKTIDQTNARKSKTNARKSEPQTQVQAAAEPERIPIPVPVPEPAAATTAVIDPDTISVGLTREELFRRFGKPATRISRQQDAELIETCWYKAPGFATVVVTLRNGKVSSQ